MNEYKRDLWLQDKNPFKTWNPICSRANSKWTKDEPNWTDLDRNERNITKWTEMGQRGPNGSKEFKWTE